MRRHDHPLLLLNKTCELPLSAANNPWTHYPSAFYDFNAQNDCFQLDEQSSMFHCDVDEMTRANEAVEFIAAQQQLFDYALELLHRERDNTNFLNAFKALVNPPL